MAHLKLFCNLDPKLALAAGANEAGDLDMPLSPQQVVELRDRHLVDVAADFTGIEYRNVGRRLSIEGNTWTHVIAALEGCKGDSSIARLQANGRAVIALLQRFGTAQQLRRWKDNEIDDQEILDVARSTAYLTFELLPRWHNKHLSIDDIAHRHDCRAPESTAAVFSVVDMSASAAAERSVALGRFERAVSRAPIAWAEHGIEPQFTSPTLHPRYHIATCPSCGRKTQRAAVLVKISWLGRAFSREYALD